MSSEHGEPGDSLPPEPQITVKRGDAAAVQAVFRAHGAALKAEAMKLKGMGEAAGEAIAVTQGNPHRIMLGLYSELEEAGRASSAGSHYIARAPFGQTLNILSRLGVFYGGPTPPEMEADDAGSIREACEALPADPVGDRRSLEQLANIRTALETLAGTLGVRIVRRAGDSPGEAV